MGNPFGIWLANQPIPSEARPHFDEAFLCYQVGAHRAALIFSWLGLLRVLAGRLLTATKPAGYPEKSWNKLQSNLQDEKIWEPTVFAAVDQTNPPLIFFADEDLRSQLRYWRGRRNDCVHSRGNIIDAPHVEALWLFIRSHLSKLVVLGGSDALIERFKIHYNPSYTPPSKSVKELVAEVPEAVRPLEYRIFIGRLLDIPELSGEQYNPEFNARRFKNLIESILSLNDPQLTEALSMVARDDSTLIVRIVQLVPNFLLSYTDDPQFIRKLWYDILPFGDRNYHPFRFIRDSSLRVVATMMRTGLIPESERAEAWDNILEKFAWDSDLLQDMSSRLLDELELVGFLDAVESKAFSTNPDIDWAESHIGLCVDFLHRRTMTKQIAATFIGLASKVSGEPEAEIAVTLGTLWYHFNYNGEGQAKFGEIIETARVEGLDYNQFERILGPKQE